jgi:hypothetical protein
MPHYHSISQLIPKVVRLLEIMTVITERRFKLAFAGKLDGCYGMMPARPSGPHVAVRGHFVRSNARSDMPPKEMFP